MLLDEPCSALDPISGRIEELIAELKQDYTVVIVTHNMQQAARCSDHGVYVLGELIEFSNTDDLFTKPAKQTRRLHHQSLRLIQECVMDSLNLNKHISGQFKRRTGNIRAGDDHGRHGGATALSDAITAMHNRDSDLAKRVIRRQNVNMMEWRSVKPACALSPNVSRRQATCVWLW